MGKNNHPLDFCDLDKTTTYQKISCASLGRGNCKHTSNRLWRKEIKHGNTGRKN